MTPEIKEAIDSFVVSRRIILHQGWVVRSAHHVADRRSASSTWTVDLQPAVEALSTPKSNFSSETGITLTVERVILATGASYTVEADPLLQQIVPILPQQAKAINGLPILTPNLRWSHDVPLFLMGAPAQLQVGPDAANLNGALIASALIVDSLEICLQTAAHGRTTLTTGSESRLRDDSEGMRFNKSHGNSFFALHSLPDSK